MPQEVSLSQISHKTYAMHLQGISPEVLPSIIHILKSHRGIWNSLLKHYQIPIVRTQAFLAELAQAHPKVLRKDVPIGLIKGVVSHRSCQKDDKKVVYILPRQKWNRMLVFDPLFLKKYQFLNTFLHGSSSAKDSTKIQFKRYLILLWDVMVPSWTANFFERYKLAFKPVDYQSLTPDCLYKIRSIPLKEHEIQYLTYERMVQIGTQGLHHQILIKYHGVVCDDGDLWMFQRDPMNALYGGVKAQVKGVATKILSTMGSEKDMIIFLSSFSFKKIDELLQVLSILKPYNFGVDPLKVAKGQANDATWMKKRYGKNSKYMRELTYLMSSTVYISLFNPTGQSSEPSTSLDCGVKFYDSWLSIPFSQEQMYKLKAVDSRHRSVNKKNLLSSLQTHRTIGSHILTHSQQAKYLKDLRQALTLQKMKDIFKWIYHMVEEKGIRLAVVVENSWGLELLEKFLKEQQVSYVVYQIKYEETKENLSYKKFNFTQAKICLLVRDKLLSEYKSACLEREKEWQLGDQRVVEEELGLERGGIFQLAQYRKSQNYSQYLGLGLKTEDPLSLQKITTVRHMVLIDVFWHDFSAAKQKIIKNIFDWKIAGYDQARSNESRLLNEDGLVTDWKSFSTVKTAELVRHYWVVKDSYQSSILQKYLINYQSFQEEQLEKEQRLKEGGIDSLQHFWDELVKEQMKKFKDVPVVEGVYDVDEEFDKLEYAAQMDQKQIEKEEKEGKIDDEPVYNTKIQGLVVETPRIDELKPKSEKKGQYINKFRIELKKEDGQVELQNISWLESSEDDGSSGTQGGESEEDDQNEGQESEIDKYLVIPKPEEKPSEKHQKRHEQEDQQMKIICVPSKKMKVQSSFSEESLEKQKIIQIPEPPKLITVREDPAYAPISTALKHLQEVQSAKKLPSFKAELGRRQKPGSRLSVNSLTKRTLWGSSQNKEKMIARMKKVLKVKLVPLKSILTYE